MHIQRCLVVTWLVPRETAAISTHVLCTCDDIVSPDRFHSTQYREAARAGVVMIADSIPNSQFLIHFPDPFPGSDLPHGQPCSLYGLLSKREFDKLTSLKRKFGNISGFALKVKEAKRK